MQKTNISTIGTVINDSRMFPRMGDNGEKVNCCSFGIKVIVPYIRANGESSPGYMRFKIDIVKDPDKVKYKEGQRVEVSGEFQLYSHKGRTNLNLIVADSIKVLKQIEKEDDYAF